MKIPKKILIIILVIAGLAGAGKVAVNKMGQSLEKLMEDLEKTTIAEKGNLEKTLISSGHIVFKDNQDNNFNEIKVQINVDASDIGKVKKGQEVSVKADILYDDTVNGYVDKITQTLDKESKKVKYLVDVIIEKSLYEVGNVSKDESIVRSGASKYYQAIKTLNKDEKVKIVDKVLISKQDKWYKVITEDRKIGWINSYDIIIEGLNTDNLDGIIANDTVSIYKGFAKNTGLVTKVVQGDVVKILDKKNNWYKVRLWDNQEGWLRDYEVITEKLKPEMEVSATILLESKKDVVYLPIECLTKTEDGYTVTLASTYEQVPVQVGINNEDYIEIIDGVSVGDEVVVPYMLDDESNNVEF